MAPRNRRSVLRTAATGFGVLGAGCTSSNESGLPANNQSSPSENRSPPPDDDESEEDVFRQDKNMPPGSPALPSEGSWPSYRFDAGNTGANPGGAGLRDGTPYWELDAGRGAAVADGTLYNVFSNRDKLLTFRDPATAAVETSSSLVQYGVNSPPVVANGRVFVTTFIEVLCFDAESGKRLWRGPEMNGIMACPTVSDGTVLINTGGFDGVQPQLRAFNAASGEELWTYKTSGESRSVPAVGETQAFISSTGGLHAIDLMSGKERFVLEEAAHDNGATPVVHDGTVYAINADGTLVAADTTDGTVRWRFTVSSETYPPNVPPVVSDGVVYTHSESGVVALDATDGSTVATSQVTAWPDGLVGDVLYVSGDGTVSALDAASGLDTLWSLETEGGKTSPDSAEIGIYYVTPVNEAVYVSAADAFYGIGPK